MTYNNGSTDATKVIPISHVRRQVAWDDAYKAEADLPDDARTIGFSTSRWIHIDQSSNPGGVRRFKKYHTLDSDF